MTTQQAKRVLQEFNIRRLELYVDGRVGMSKELEDIMREFELENPALLCESTEDLHSQYLATLFADIAQDKRVLEQKQTDARRIKDLTNMIEKAQNDFSVSADVRNIRAHAFTQVLEYEKRVYASKWGKE